MALTSYLKAILESTGQKVDPDGLVSSASGDSWAPAMINGRRLVLPLPAVLSNPNWDATIPFHPLSEKIMRGESVILKALRTFICGRLTYVASSLWEEVMALAVDTDRHRLLSPAQLKAILPAPDANENTLKRLHKVIRHIAPSGDRALINIYQKRGGEIDGIKYSRVAVVTFPIAELLFEEGKPRNVKEILGVTGISANDCKSIIGILDFILPEIYTTNHYSAGSLSTAAPYFHSLMLAYASVAVQLNKVTALLRNVIKDPEELHIDLDSWFDMLDDLDQFKGEIPSLRDSEGEITDELVASKRAASHLVAGSSLNVGTSERVPYEAPAFIPTPPPASTPTPTSTGQPAGERTSSWSNARARLYGHNAPLPSGAQIPPTLRSDAPPPPQRVPMGTDRYGRPLYEGDVVGAAPVQTAPTMGYLDHNGQFVATGPVGAPPPQQQYYQQQPQPYVHGQYGGAPPHPYQDRRYANPPRPMTSRQAANIGRAGVSFPTTRR